MIIVAALFFLIILVEWSLFKDCRHERNAYKYLYEEKCKEVEKLRKENRQLKASKH